MLGAPVLACVGDASTPGDSSAKASDNQIVCHSYAPTTGSRIGARCTCRTAQEWEQINRNAKSNTNNGRAKAMPSRPPPGPAGGGH